MAYSARNEKPVSHSFPQDSGNCWQRGSGKIVKVGNCRHLQSDIIRWMWHCCTYELICNYMHKTCTRSKIPAQVVWGLWRPALPICRATDTVQDANWWLLGWGWFSSGGAAGLEEGYYRNEKWFHSSELWLLFHISILSSHGIAHNCL